MYQTIRLPAFSSSLLLTVANYFADYQGTCLLYSGGEFDSAKQSFLALFPYEIACAQGKKSWVQREGEKQLKENLNPWEGLQELFFDHLDPQAEAYAFGFFGYEMGVFADLDSSLAYPSSVSPLDAYWQRCALVLIYDHPSCSASVILSAFAIPWLSCEEGKWMKRLSDLAGWQKFLDELSVFSYKEAYTGILSLRSYPNRRGDYLQRIEKAKEKIRAGDIYQVNLSHRFIFEGWRRPFDVFLNLSLLNPAPFSAYLKTIDYAIVSTSPERFLQKKGNYLETRPIKGTMPRGKNAQEDAAFKEQLLASVKEKAELLMITDLMRNDLGRISEVGSVITQEIWRCEGYANVFHLLSIICSRVKPNLTPLDIIRACFPGGSITGCPKLKAMEMIQNLESKPRGIYTGSLGFITGTGDFDLNIAIRTLVFKNNTICLQLGAGIVIDSNPEQEYKETLFKGDSIFKTLQKLT